MEDSLSYIIQESEIHIDSLASDSLFAKMDSVVIKEIIPNYFTPSLYHPINIDLRNVERLTNAQNEWFTLLFFGLVLYLIIVRLLYSFDILENIKGLFKIHSLDTVGFEKQTQFTGYFLAPIAIFVYSFYLYFVINPEFLQLKLDHLYLVFTLASIAIFAVKTLFEKIVSVIFEAQKTFNLYFSDHLFILGVSSLIQAPFVVLYFYSSEMIFLWISIVLFIIFWLFRLIRGMLIGINQTTFYKSYIFLYLCSLEILPIIVAYKWALG